MNEIEKQLDDLKLKRFNDLADLKDTLVDDLNNTACFDDIAELSVQYHADKEDIIKEYAEEMGCLA